MKQAIVLAVGGLAICLVILRLGRRRLLTTRYTLGWLGLGAFVGLAAIALPFVSSVGTFAGMTPTAVLLVFSSLVLLAISVQLSISVSLLQERLRTTAEAHALLARRVADMEQQAG